MIRYGLLILLWLLCFSHGVYAEVASAFVRISLVNEPAQPKLGQERQLSVKLYTTTWLRKAPRYPELEVAGALVVRPASFAHHSQEQIDGVDYIVQEQLYRLYPRRIGAFYVPPLQLSLSVLSHGKEQRLTVQSDDLLFSVADNDASFVARDLTLTERYRLLRAGQVIELDPEQAWVVQVGDIIERRLRLQAAHSTAVLLPRLQPEQGSAPRAGKAVFNQAKTDVGAVFYEVQTLQDSEHRGEFAAVREELWRYDIRHAGKLQLAPLTLSYWDSELAAHRTITLPAKIVKVQSSKAIMSFFLLGLLPLIMYLGRGPLIGWLKAIRVAMMARIRADGIARKLVQENIQFRKLLHYLKADDANSFARQYPKWWQSLVVAAPSLDRYHALACYLSKPFINRADQLGDDFGVATIGELSTQLQLLRRELLSEQGSIPADKNVCLPDLNPTGPV